MKKFLAYLLVLASLAMAFPAWAAPVERAGFTLGSYQYRVNENSLIMDATPFVQEGRIFVPIRFLAYACGVADDNIQWDNRFELVTLKKENTTLQLQVAVDQAIKNGKVEELDAAPIYRNGRTYLPARWIAEGLGFQVQWDDKSKTVSISK